MVKFLSAFFIFIVATLLHWVFVEIFAPLDIAVGVMFAFSLVMAAQQGRIGGYIFGFFSGLFLDFFGNAMFGGYALVFTIMIFWFYKIEDKIDFKEAAPQIVVAMALNLALVLIYGLLGSIFAGSFLWQGFKSLVLGSLITGLLVPVIYVIVVKYLIFESVKRPHESKSIL